MADEAVQPVAGGEAAPIAPLRAMSPPKVGKMLGVSERVVQLWCAGGEKYPEPCPHTRGGSTGKRILLNLEEVKAWMAKHGIDARLGLGAGVGEKAVKGGGDGGGAKEPPLTVGGDAAGGLFDPSLQAQSGQDDIASLSRQVRRLMAAMDTQRSSPAQFAALVKAINGLDDAVRRREDRAEREEQRRRVMVPRSKVSRLQATLGTLVRTQVENLVLTAPAPVREACVREGVSVGQADAFDRVASGVVRHLVNGVLGELAAGFEREAVELERLEVNEAA
ncbi:MAG: hypothetical protein ACREJO_13820 [Phycisphaerales bacterium]